MAETKEQFSADVVAAHDELIDVATELEALLLEVPELGFEPAVVASLNAQVNGILDHIDEAHAALFNVNQYLAMLDTETPEAGGQTEPAGNVNEVFAPGTEDVAAPVPAEDNLISKPVEDPYVASQEPFVVKDAEGNVVEEASPVEPVVEAETVPAPTA